ncbi:MAG TPA: VWA domain-containing protein [Flavobacteriales bacterium]|nr:VWA domain-containing protein [Flavobacteriales bacterium]
MALRINNCVMQRNSRVIGVFCFMLLFIFNCSVCLSQNQRQETPLTRILFVFDGSQSMYGRWKTGMKIKIAQKLLGELIDSISYRDDIQLAFRAYGHQYPVISREKRNCEDSKLEVPFGKNNIAKIKKSLNAIQPKGTTPIAYSLGQSANDFPPCDNCRNIIILITDGIEECDGDPCAVSWALQKKGIILKPFVIGMGLDEDIMKQFECVGNFYDATNEKVFKNVLNIVISQVLNSTSVQVNLLDQYGQPTETDVNMTFYDRRTKEMRYNYIHTINHRGNPDTIVIDPLGAYQMTVHTIPAVEVDSIKLIPGVHNIIAADAPQGQLSLKIQGRSDYKSLQCIVRQHGKMNTLNVQDFNTSIKYLVGKYDLEVLSLPRLNFSVDIKQSHTNTVEIPQPGIASILLASKGHGDIFLEKNNKLELIYTIDPLSTRETLVMQPGRYRLIFKPKSSRESIYTQEKSFKISSGTSTQVRL